MTQDATTVYSEIIERVRHVLGCRGAFLGLLEDDGSLLITVQSGLDDGPLVGWRIPPGEGLAADVLASGRSQVADDYVADPRSVNGLRAAARRQGFVSLAGTPLAHAGAALGVLYAAHHAPGFFTAEHLRLLEAYAVCAALAVRCVKVAEELEDALTEREALFREAPDPIIIHTLDDARIVDVNLRACRTYGYSREEFLRLTIADLDSPEHAPARDSRLQRIRRDRHASFTTEHRAADGTYLEVDVAATVLSYNDGRELAYTVSRDVTARRELERRLRQSDRIASLGRLVAGVTHELNTPLTVILGLTEMVEGEPLDPVLREDVASIRREASRAARIVRDLQAFAQIRESTPCVVQLNDVVRRAFAAGAQARKAAGIEGALRLDPDAPPLWGDEHGLEQAVANLITNAQAAAAEGPHVHAIEVRTATVADPVDGAVRVDLTVSDTGPGVAPGDLPRLFEPFFTTRGPGRGLGLGLSLCHGVVEEMGGTLIAVNLPEGGTRVTAGFPTVLESEPPAGLQSNGRGREA